MINFHKATIALGLAAASLGLAVATTSTAVAGWDFQHRTLTSGFNNNDQLWGPGIGGVAPPISYNVYEPYPYEPNCYLTTQTAFGNYGFAYYAIERVCR